MQSGNRALFKQCGISVASLCLAVICWILLIHLFFTPPKSSVPEKISPDAKAMAVAQLQLWRDPGLKAKELEAMRRSNSEWDFMGRTFLVLALCEMSERDSASKPENLAVIDSIIDETLTLEARHGMHFFLMPYSKWNSYRVEPARSLFLDGEIALMLATRRVVEEKAAYKELFATRAKLIEERLNNALVIAESYPNECWLFDHAIGLAALRIGDYLDGTDHRVLFAKWTSVAKEKLTHAKSGMLVSSYMTDARWLDGPEGSSIWGAAHFLRFIDEDLARAQYENARREIGRTLLGFGWSREWPVSWSNHSDIDSGAVVPVVNASAGASGMALIAAASFGDEEFYRALKSSLNFAAFPVRNHGALRYSASNAVGDAALLYGETLGAIHAKVIQPLHGKKL